jgi:hypothetical protein
MNRCTLHTDHGHTYKLYLNQYFFDRAFEYGGISNFKVMLGQTLAPISFHGLFIKDVFNIRDTNIFFLSFPSGTQGPFRVS